MIDPVNLSVHAAPQVQDSSITNPQSLRLLELTGWVSSTITAELGRLRAEQASTLPALQNLSSTAAMAAALNMQAPSVTGVRVLSLSAEEAALTNLQADPDFGTDKVRRRKRDSHQSDKEPFTSSDKEDPTTASDAPFDQALLHAIEIALETMQKKIELSGWSGNLAAYVFPGQSLVSQLDGVTAAHTDCDLVVMVCGFDGSFGDTGYLVIVGYASDQLIVTCDAFRVADDFASERGSGDGIWSIHNCCLDAVQASIHCKINDESIAGVRIVRQRIVAEPQTWHFRPRVAKWH